MHKSEIEDLGTKQDLNRRETKRRVDDDRWCMLVETARDMIHKDGVRPGAKAISQLLESRSLNPTRAISSALFFMKITPYLSGWDAFSDCLSKYGFDFHSMFVIDLLHEFELGVCFRPPATTSICPGWRRHSKVH